MDSSSSAKKLHLLSVSPSEDELWKIFREGSREALGKIYRKQVDGLYHYGMHFCGDSDRVKDCLQDLFRDLWLEREQLSPDIKSLKYYLFSSLRRHLLRALKKDRRYHTDELTGTFEIEITPSQEETMILKEIHKEQTAQLQTAIASLSRRQREAIYLRFYQDLSYAEISQLMSLKVESVYNLISKAIGLLKEMLPLYILLLTIL